VKKIILAFVACLTFSACERNTDFLQRPAAPPAQEKPIPAPVPDPVVVKPGPYVSKTVKLGETTSQTFASDVDIVWIIDNSNSMGTYQQQVIDNTSVFIKSFVADSRLHWQMGLLSTDLSEDPYIGFSQNNLDWKTSNPVPIFQDGVRRLGIEGDSTERSFDPFVKNVQRYPNYLRKNAYVALIMVSDEPEQSDGQTATSFYNYLVQLKGGDANKVISYGVFPTQGFTCGFGFESQTQYADFIKLSGGKIYNLCSSDYGPNLAALGKDLVKQISVLNPVIPLQDAADLKTLKVQYRGQTLKQGFLSEGGQWLYDSETNTIRIVDPTILDPSFPEVTISYNIIAG
jgi:hypothetical protein